ncbi:HNH endonuclease signature motif containing protein [Amycolatopsis nigrescens]|uniref:HNH endonuclease signature motif containing protein n=1 Tax=Amycolatopsis nigrescens TaxID=381445 RepID=UPI0004781C37|nr:HNH endonuclease signature motif containing protein [Amycolatopsis nigrescens]
MDETQAVPAWQLSDGELTAALLHTQAVLSRTYGRMLALVAEVDGRGLASAKGYRNTAAFLSGAMRLSAREAKARVAQATTPMPLTGKALAEGVITVEHVTEIHRVLVRAPEGLDPEKLEYAEQALVELAGQAPPLSVRQAGARLLAYWDVDTKGPGDPEDGLARPRRRFRYWFAADGQMHFAGELDPETAALLQSIVTPLARPRPLDEFGREDGRTLAQRQGDALAETIGLAAHAPELPVTGGERALMMVTIGLDELERRAGAAYLDGVGYTSVSQLRRLCCDAKVVPAVLGSSGEILDLGRARRLASPAQCRALAIRDRGCARPGCGRPPKYCQAHHIKEWVDGGDTDIGNLVLLCEFHHRELHHTGWSVRMADSGVPEFIPPKWLDQEQRPIRNTAHDLPHQHAA